MSELQNALSVIQQTLNAPKNQYNSFGKYSYRNCEDILMAVKPLLGQCVIVVDDEMVCVGNRVYVKSTATIMLGTEEISATAFARESESRKGMDDSQLTGATSSYARKYALNGLLLIDDNKDADSSKPTDASKIKQGDPNMDLIAEAIKNNDSDFVKQNWTGLIANCWPKLSAAQSEALNALFTI